MSVPQPAVLAELDRLMRIERPTAEDPDRGKDLIIALGQAGAAEGHKGKWIVSDSMTSVSSTTMSRLIAALPSWAGR